MNLDLILIDEQKDGREIFHQTGEYVTAGWLMGHYSKILHHSTAPMAIKKYGTDFYRLEGIVQVTVKKDSLAARMFKNGKIYSDGEFEFGSGIKLHGDVQVFIEGVNHE